MGNHGGFDLDGTSSLTKCIVSSPPYMENRFLIYNDNSAKPASELKTKANRRDE